MVSYEYVNVGYVLYFTKDTRVLSWHQDGPWGGAVYGYRVGINIITMTLVTLIQAQAIIANIYIRIV